jgi:hypothetical protein
VVRNVVCCAAPIFSDERQDVRHYIMELSPEFRPRTFWLDGERAASLEDEGDSL